jgi:integrase
MARKAAAAPTRVELGPYWLEYRAERSEWCIAWYDAAARTRRRRSTGLGGGTPADPPEPAREALARFYLEASRPAEPQKTEAAPVADLLRIWLRDHVAGKADPARYAISAAHLLRFFDRERQLGRIIGGVTVADVNKTFVDSFIAFRKAEGVGGHTISRDLAALRSALNHAWREELIVSAPFVKDVSATDKAKPRNLVYTQQEVARLLEAAWGRPDRHHVFLYTMIQMSTCGRSEAILDLHDHQIDNGLIYFLDPDRDQTSKRRSVVPVAPTLAPWLDGLSGKIVKYRAATSDAARAAGAPDHFERDCHDLGKSFDACLIEAGLSRPVLNAQGEPVMLKPRAKSGESEPRPKLRGRGTPNTLRHTIISEMHKRGVDERQIDMAAGHAPIGTGKRNYMHLRPDFLAELIAAVEDYWHGMRRFTTVHLRSQCGPNIINFAGARATARTRP